tara:strand:+ start:56 stop:649 length:594 start_codon:yes stop_codon:yes gene_type:complete
MSDSNRNSTSWVGLFFNAFTAFLHIQKGDSGSKKTVRVSGAVLKRGIFLALDYWVTAVEAVFSVWLYANLPLTGTALLVTIFLSLWVFEIVVALFFIIQWRITGIDITLSEDWRRAIDVISEGSKRVGTVAYWLKILKAVIWDGPEEIVIFCHKELRSIYKISLVLLGVTTFQAAFWGGTFIGMYEFVVQPIISYLW